MRALIPNSTQIPDVILDHWMARLSGAEFKVVLYIARRTFGFGKESDTISINQLAKGIRKRDGTQLDHGTGLSRSAVKSACSSLVARGVLIKTQATVQGSDEPDQNTYRLNLYAPMEDEELEPPEGENGNEGENSGSNQEVGQNMTQVGQKSAHLETTSEKGENSPEKVGQKKAHVGQKVTQVGQTAPYGGPDSVPGVGQNLAPQDTDQETEEQETATTAGEPKPTSGPSSAAAEASPSALGKEGDLATELLIAAGFSERDARHIASSNPTEVVREQIGFLPYRNVKKNRLGLLRKAIEERWPKPESDEQAKKREAAEKRSAQEGAEAARKREIVTGLRQMYSRLPKDAPEAFQAFLGHIEERKGREAARPLISQSPKRLEIMLAAYDQEDRRLALMVEYFSERGAPIAEYAPLLSSFKAHKLPPVEELLASEAHNQQPRTI